MIRRLTAILASIALVAVTCITTPIPAIYWSGVEHASTASADANGGLFNDSAALDTSEVVYLMPKGTHDGRPDWDKAMAACAAAGFDLTDCLASVADGEF